MNIARYCFAAAASAAAWALGSRFPRLGLAAAVCAGLLIAFVAGRLRLPSRGISNISGAGIWAVDSAGLITWSNQWIAETLGFPPAGLTGRKLEDFLFPADISAERIRFDNRRPGVPDQFDRRLRHANGSEVWLLTSSGALPSPRGTRDVVLSVMIDITERKQAELALRLSERRFRNLFENIIDGVYQTTPDGRIIAANPMLLQMLGVSSERELNEVVAVDLYVDPGIRRRLTGRLEREGSFRNVIYDLRRRDGHTITVRENARVVRDEEGNVLYYEGTLTDITHQRPELVRSFR